MSERDEEKANERGFVVVDRRGEEDAESAEASPASQTAADPSAPAGREPGPGPATLPQIDLQMLLHSFAISALFHMGAAPDPATGEAAEVNLPLAQQNIQILELLEQKTEGNLTPQEKELLEGLLYEVRLRYVEARKSHG